MTMNNYETLYEVIHAYDIPAEYDEPLYNYVVHGHYVNVIASIERVHVSVPVSDFDRWANSRLCILDTTKPEQLQAFIAFLDTGETKQLRGYWENDR